MQQPSPVEIQREVEALRDIRRRSTTQGGPGTLVLDPDLPNEAAPSSPTASYWTSSSSNPGLTDGDSSSSSHEGGSDSTGSADDPFHLFWVPASLHPEIAPTEFRAFLKEHARAPPSEAGGNLSRSSSATSTSSGLGRRASMLSRQYRPKDGDESEEEKVVPTRRNRNSIYHPGPQLTISDLQKLEELAEEASASDDPTKLRTVLRRSLSLNVSPSSMDTMDNMPDPGEDADAPIIVPRPGQILRRAARTKIRKPGLPGDGGGHRFGSSTRRGTTGSVQSPAPPVDARSSSDMSTSDHGEIPDPAKRGRVLSQDSFTEEPKTHRPSESFSEEASSIFDSYIRPDFDEDDSRTAAPSPAATRPTRVVVTSPPSPASIELPLSPPPQQYPPQTEPIPIPSTSPVIHQPQPQRVSELRPPAQDSNSLRTTSPDSMRSGEGPTSRSQSPGSDASSFMSTSPGTKKEKDKKGLFGFGSKSNKKAGKEKDKEKEKEQRERERAEREREREEEKRKEKAEKESGFFGSLFGKKKQDEAGGSSPTAGSSKSPKGFVPPVSPQFAGINGSYARYPIHVERAIYRLSHIKLANPRRPLYEQVLISNLMFWYLGVINKTQNPGPTSPGSPSQAGTPTPSDQQAREQEQREAEERQRVEKERAEKERLEKEREREQQQKKEPRRGSLTKAPTGGQQGRRQAEMPVKGPQYGMQHRVMEQEYGYGAGSPPRSNTMPAPGGGQTRSGPGGNQDVYYSTGGGGSQRPSQQPHLPPGAMAPSPNDQMNWLSSPPSQATSPPKNRAGSPPSSPPAGSSSPPPRRSRSPPPHNQNRFAPSPALMPELYNNAQVPAAPTSGAPSRSRSASATPPPPPNTNSNGKIRKNSSAHAVLANGRAPRKSDGAGDEEDVPLALWQQRQPRR